MFQTSHDVTTLCLLLVTFIVSDTKYFCSKKKKTKIALLYAFNAFKEYGSFVIRYRVVDKGLFTMFDIVLLLLAVFFFKEVFFHLSCTGIGFFFLKLNTEPIFL